MLSALLVLNTWALQCCELLWCRCCVACCRTKERETETQVYCLLLSSDVSLEGLALMRDSSGSIVKTPERLEFICTRVTDKER